MGSSTLHPVTYFPVATQRQLERNRRAIQGKPYAHYFDDRLELRDAVLPSLRSAMEPGDALRCDPASLNTLLEPGYHAVENGFCQLEDGTAYVASHVPMPGCTGEMYRWWFWWHAVEPQRYTLWYPHNHIRAVPTRPEVLTEPGLSHEARYVGTTHHVDEYIGPDLVRLAIRFVDPKDLGFDTSRFAEAGIVGHACARVGLRGTGSEAVTMVHLARQTDSGIEQRSRYWMGHDVRLGGRVSIDALARWLGLKAIMGGVRVAHEQLLHDQIEFTHLSTFLPRLFAELG